MSFQQLQQLQGYLTTEYSYDCVVADEYVDPENPTEVYPAHCHVNYNDKSMHFVVEDNEFYIHEVTANIPTGVPSDNQTNWSEMDTIIKNYLG